MVIEFILKLLYVLFGYALPIYLALHSLSNKGKNLSENDKI